MVAGLAQDQGVCVRPLARRLVDRVSGEASTVVLPCGSTQESRCPTCAKRARVLRMHQCAEGWHRVDELPDADLEPAGSGLHHTHTRCGFGPARSSGPDRKARTLKRCVAAPNPQHLQTSLALLHLRLNSTDASMRIADGSTPRSPAPWWRPRAPGPRPRRAGGSKEPEHAAVPAARPLITSPASTAPRPAGLVRQLGPDHSGGLGSRDQCNTVLVNDDHDSRVAGGAGVDRRPVENAASKDCCGGSKTWSATKCRASGAPTSLSIPASSHSIDSGPA